MATQQQGKRDDSCPFNHEVMCKRWPCECGICGWNPAVAKYRLDKIRDGLLDAAGEEAAKE